MAKRSKVGKFFTPKTVISGIVILIAIAAAIGANVIVPYDPNEVDPRSCFLPAFSKGHILGTDKLGRDLLSRLIMGAKSSMLNAFLIVAFEVVIGVPIGLICGYYGGKIDAVIMRIWDVVCSIPSLLLSFILIAIFGRGFLHKYLEGILPVFYLGLVLNIFCVTFMTILVFHPLFAKAILVKGMKLLERLHLMKKKGSRLKKLEDSMDTYRDTAAYLKNNPTVIVKVIGITFIQRMALFAVTWFVYQSFGLHGTGFWEILFLQAVISVSVDMLPLPGGMGISESLYLVMFAPVFGEALLPAMLLSRGISYYAQMLISAVMTCVAYFIIGRKEQEEK